MQCGKESQRLLVTRVTLIAALAVLVVTALLSARGAVGTTRPDEFIRLLRVVHYDYVVAESPRELAARADITVTGRISSVSPGRTLRASSERPEETVVFEVAVSAVLEGDPARVTDGHVYFEVPRMPYQSLAEFERSLPSGDVVLFLDDRSDFEDMANASAGRPKGTPIFGVFPQGLWLEYDDSALSVYVPNHENPPNWLGIQTLADLIEALSD
jgi:hypothetical protein